jgi:hypothetical protein
LNLRWARRVLYAIRPCSSPTRLKHGDTEPLQPRPSGFQVVPPAGVAEPAAALREDSSRALAVKALLPHVDTFLPVHNLASLEQLAGICHIRAGGAPHRQGARRWN